jgi:transposase-like protein
VCADLANLGIKDVLVVCCDGLTGFPEAIAATWSQAAVQTCVVHLIRNALRFVSYSDRKAVATALKPVYTAANAKAARAELDAFAASELGVKTPM